MDFLKPCGHHESERAKRVVALRQSIFLAGALIFVSAFHLIPAWLNEEIPSRQPVRPITRSGRPYLFWFGVAVFVTAGTVGVLILTFTGFRALWITMSI